MAFYGPINKFVDSSEAVVAPGAVIEAEGLALVRVTGSQSQGVLPGTGAATETFVGFSSAGTSAAPFPEAYDNKVETFLVPGSGIVTLARTPVTGQVFVRDITDPAGVTNPVTVVNNTITGLPAGDEVEVTYKFALSVLEARARFGDVQPGGYSGAYVGQIGLVKRGLIATSEYDASKDWTKATVLRVGAGGQVTCDIQGGSAGTGAVINGYVVEIPTQDAPYLTIEFSAA